MVFDAHVHVFPDKIAEKATGATGAYYGVSMYSVGSLDNIKKCLEEKKMDKCLIHSTATKPEQVESVNDYIASLCEENEAFVGFGTIHPDYSDIEKEVERIISLGLKGIKIHSDFQGFDIDDKKAYPIYKAAEGRLPILFHMGDANVSSSHPKRLWHIMKAFPELTVIAAHLGGYCAWDDAKKYLIGAEGHIYLDTSSALEFMSSEEGKDIILTHGVDRVLYGSDFPMHDPANCKKLIKALGLSSEDEEKIFHKNVEKLLGIKK